MKLRHLGAGILIAGSTMLCGCAKHSKSAKYPKAFTKEFAIRDSLLSEKLDSLVLQGVPSDKREKRKFLHELNKTAKEKIMLQKIERDSLLRKVKQGIDSLKQIVKNNKKN